MHSFKKSLIALVGLLALIVTLLALAPPVGAQSRDLDDLELRRVIEVLRDNGQRKFYLTKTADYNGSQARSACAEGYHMASLWEILDPSNLRYNRLLGFTRADSGLGPPNATRGWIRTGFDADASATVGTGNCQAWTSDHFEDRGTSVLLTTDWSTTTHEFVTRIGPWVAGPFSCFNTTRVWCVQD